MRTANTQRSCTKTFHLTKREVTPFFLYPKGHIAQTSIYTSSANILREAGKETCPHKERKMEIIDKIDNIVKSAEYAIRMAETPEKRAKLEMIYSSHMRETAAAEILSYTREEKNQIRAALDAGDDRIHAARMEGA